LGKPVSASCSARCAIRASAAQRSVRHRLMTQRDLTPVLQRDDCAGRTIGGIARRHLGHVLLEWHGRIAADGGAKLHDFPQGHTGPDLFRRQPVYLGVAPVAEQEPPTGIEDAHAVRHIIERNGEAGRLFVAGAKQVLAFAVGLAQPIRQPAELPLKLGHFPVAAAIGCVDQGQQTREIRLAGFSGRHADLLGENGVQSWCSWPRVCRKRQSPSICTARFAARTTQRAP
jgi:hypothetical protein